jgi:hypothetical protein
MMCTLTQRDLDFLASLKTGWRRLYRRELVRILKGDAGPEGEKHRPRGRNVGSTIIDPDSHRTAAGDIGDA